MRRHEIEVGRIYVLGHRDGRFGDVYIRPVAVNGLRTCPMMPAQALEHHFVFGKIPSKSMLDA